MSESERERVCERECVRENKGELYRKEWIDKKEWSFLYKVGI